MTMHIVIVDRIHLAGEALAIVLNKEADIKVVGVAHTVDEALEQIASLGCDLLLANAHLYEDSALYLIEEVKQIYPNLRIIVLGLADSQAVIRTDL